VPGKIISQREREKKIATRIKGKWTTGQGEKNRSSAVVFLNASQQSVQ
jgi:hypothetical protein